MNNAEFERIYTEHAEALLGFLVYRVGDRALAEDVLADTFERVLRTRLRFDPRKSSEKTWIYSIALNRLRDLVRRQAVETRALAAVSVPAGDGGGVGAVEERASLTSALEQLSADEREVVALRFGADLKLEEIAGLIGEPRSTVEGRLYRALRKLKTQLD